MNQPVRLHCSGSDDTFLNKDSTENMNEWKVSISVFLFSLFNDLVAEMLTQKHLLTV